MLNAHQTQVLRELEGRLSAEDPAFTRSFTALGEKGRPHTPTSSADTTAIVTVILTLLLGVPLFLAGSLLGALAVSALPGLLWLVWRHSSARAD